MAKMKTEKMGTVVKVTTEKGGAAAYHVDFGDGQPQAIAPGESHSPPFNVGDPVVVIFVDGSVNSIASGVE